MAAIKKKSIIPNKAEKKRGTHKLGRYYCGQNRARSFLGSLRHFLKHALKKSDQQIHTTLCILVVTVIFNSIILIKQTRFIHLIWLSPTRTIQLQNPQKKKKSENNWATVHIKYIKSYHVCVYVIDTLLWHLVVMGFKLWLR